MNNLWATDWWIVRNSLKRACDILYYSYHKQETKKYALSVSFKHIGSYTEDLNLKNRSRRNIFIFQKTV